MEKVENSLFPTVWVGKAHATIPPRMAPDRRDTLSGTTYAATLSESLLEPSRPVENLELIHMVIHRNRPRLYHPLALALHPLYVPSGTMFMCSGESRTGRRIMQVLIYRKAAKTRKPTKAQREEMQHLLMLARVRKPQTEEFFMSGAFHRLPVVPSHVVKNAPLRKRDHADSGWEVPEEEYGNVKRGDEYVGQVIHAWIVRYVVAAGIVERDEFAVVVQD